MNAAGSPRFFCDNCGTEVPRNAKSCPKCGRQFSSVLCPSCGFAGEERQFKEGCPVCGYSSKAPPYKKGGDYGDFPTDSSESKMSAGPLPLWAYILTAAIFTAVMAALVFTVLH